MKQYESYIYKNIIKNYQVTKLYSSHRNNKQIQFMLSLDIAIEDLEVLHLLLNSNS